MRLKKRQAPEGEVDMTPMIDMVFLLLVFFMTAATMSSVEFTPEIRLPTAPNAVVPDDLRARGTINILPLNSVTSHGETVTEASPFMVGGRLVDESRLTEFIGALRREEPELRVYMRIDRQADFVLVRRAIRACAEAGVFDIVFASFQSGDGA